MNKQKSLIKILNFLKKDFFSKNDYYLKIFNRNIKVTENMVGLKLSIYNGKFFIPIKVTENMIGNLLGSFSFSHNILLFNKENRRRFKKK